MLSLQRIPYVMALTVALGCGQHSPTALRTDPTLLIRNHSNVTVYFTWQDGRNIIGNDVITPNVSRACERFIARADSAYFQFMPADTMSGGWHIYRSNYFDPSSRAAWIVDLQAPDGQPRVADTTATPC